MIAPLAQDVNDYFVRMVLESADCSQPKAGNHLMTFAESAAPSSRVTRGYLIALVGTAIWSSTAVFIRYLTDAYPIPPLVLAFWRDVFACLILIVALRLLSPGTLRWLPGQLRFFTLYGLILSLFNALWTFSVTLNGAAISTVLAYSSGAFTAILAWWLFKESLGWGKLLAIACSLAGTFFVAGAHDLSQWQANPLGIVTGVVAGVGFAGYSLMGKESARRGINPWVAMTYTFGIAALFLLVEGQLVALLVGQTGHIVPEMPLAGWGVLFLLAMVPTIGGYGLYTVSLSYLPASVANLIATLEPSMTALQSYFLLGERFTEAQVLGSALVIAGVILLRIMERPKKPGDR